LASKQGHSSRTRQLATAVAELTAALFRESNPVPVKYALSAMGVMLPAVRLPLVELGSDTKAEIDAALARLCEGHSGYMIGEVARPEDGARGSSSVPADAALRQAPEPSHPPAGWAHPLRRARSAAVQVYMRSGGA
jgi:hypothetical protein